MSDKEKKRLERLRKMHPDLNIPDENVYREEGTPSFNEALRRMIQGGKVKPMKIVVPLVGKSEIVQLKDFPNARSIVVSFINGKMGEAAHCIQSNGRGTSDRSVFDYRHNGSSTPILPFTEIIWFEQGKVNPAHPLSLEVLLIPSE